MLRAAMSFVRVGSHVGKEKTTTTTTIHLNCGGGARVRARLFPVVRVITLESC